jgi:molecular chaperone GrpE
MKDKNNKPEENAKTTAGTNPPLEDGPAASLDEQDFVAQAQAENLPSDGEIQLLKKQIESLQGENESLKDARLRVLAEFDNYKRRTARESLRLVETANESLIRELLPVLENFERALDPCHKEKDIDAFYKGINLIYNLFSELLKKAGIVEHNPLGEDFDSEKHEAVMHMACPDVPEHKISQVLQKGYSLNNKMIKYAKVAVSKGNS